MTERTAVYRIFDASDALLYIGISKSFGKRWEQHASVQPWWPEVARQTVEWLPSRPEAEAAERAAIKAEGPRHNKMHAVRPPKPPRPKIVVVLPPSPYRTTGEVAKKAGVSRHTVEREIERGNLRADKLGNRYAIRDAEAERWMTQFQRYAEQRARD